MTHFSVPYSRIAEIPAPATYEVRSGEWWLHGSIEGGAGEARSWGERHIITINEGTGHFTCEGGYGTFSYCWPSPNRGSESLHAFLYDLDFGYFMGKASKQPHRIVDNDATIASLRKGILEDRRRHDITARKAKDLWTALGWYENEPERLVMNLYEDSDWSERLDYSDPSVMIDHPGMRRFWAEVWIPFAHAILKPHWEAHRAAQAEARAAA